MRGMKWWGWGDEGVAFSHEDKPGLRPFIKRHLHVDLSHDATPPVSFGDLRVPAPSIEPGLLAAFERAAGRTRVSTDALERVVHARGKSLRDLVRHRRGDLGRLPDVVVWPDTEQAVEAILQTALDADAVVIPFGGGTNISGSLEAPEDEDRTDRLGRSQPPGPGARDRRRLAPGAGAGGRVRPAPRRAAQRPRVDARSLPRQLLALHPGRLDRHPLLGDAVRQVRRRGRPHARAARGDPGGHARDPARAEHLDRARACARWCSAARAASGSSPRRPCTCTACPSAARSSATSSPTWADALAAMQRARRERGVAVGHAGVRRLRDRVLVRHAQGPDAAGPRQVDRAEDLPRAPPRLRPRGDVPVVHRLRGQRRATSRRSGGWSGGSSTATAACASATGPGVLYDQKKFDTPYIRDYLLDRGALADVSETVGAVERACRRSTAT